MLVGDAVTVVLGDGDTRSAVVESFRDDGAVLCKWPVSMWVPLAWIDTGDTEAFGHRLKDQITRLTQDQALVLGALFAAGSLGLIDHEHQGINGLPKSAAEARRVELERQGLVERSHDQRSMGRSLASVHLITPAGRAAWLNYQRSRGAA